jgi:hypothetical protein
MFSWHAWALIIAQVCMRYKWHVCASQTSAPCPDGYGSKTRDFVAVSGAISGCVLFIAIRNTPVEWGVPSPTRRSWSDRLGLEPQPGRSDLATGPGSN